MTLTQTQPRANFAFGLLMALLLGTLGVVVWMRPTREDLPAFAFLLVMPVALATAGAWITSRSAWWRRFRSVAIALYAAYIIGGVLIWVTVRITCQMMFISEHDAALAELIVLYATAIALVFGYFVTSALRDSIGSLSRAALEVQRGNLEVRVDDRGSDEISQLAKTFNGMTARLRDMRDDERRLENARREWIASVSHDLRTPLTSLRARTEALADGVIAEPAEVSAYLGAMKRDVEGLSRLVNDLFELATIEAGGIKLDKQRVALSDIVSDTIESMKVLAQEKGIALSGEIGDGVDPVNVNPQHIQRVLTNLVSNAIAHTHTGGVHVSTMREGGKICVYVVDTGEGISPADLPHVFDRFFRADSARARSTTRNTGGMGLGLAISKALVEAHGGKIGVESTPGKGATFWVELPG